MRFNTEVMKEFNLKNNQRNPQLNSLNELKNKFFSFSLTNYVTNHIYTFNKQITIFA